MTLQEYKDKIKDINKQANKARQKALQEYVNSLTDFRVGDKVKLIPLIDDSQTYANWEMEVNCITPCVYADSRTKKDELAYIILVGDKPDGTKAFYTWFPSQNEYKLEKIGD